MILLLDLASGEIYQRTVTSHTKVHGEDKIQVSLKKQARLFSFNAVHPCQVPFHSEDKPNKTN